MRIVILRRLRALHVALQRDPAAAEPNLPNCTGARAAGAVPAGDAATGAADARKPVCLVVGAGAGIGQVGGVAHACTGM